MLRSVAIKNYKSIVDDTIELGRINVFIGENGCGKTNILEALALLSCTLMGKDDYEDYYNRGVRLAKPNLMRSAFRDHPPTSAVESRLLWCRDDFGSLDLDCQWFPLDSSHPRFRASYSVGVRSPFEETQANATRIYDSQRIESVFAGPPPGHVLNVGRALFERSFGDFVIYNLNVLALRGLEVTSRRTPLGIHGEGLDTLIATFSDEDLADLNERARCVSWLDRIEVDRADARKLKGSKPGRSRSILYFADRYMTEDDGSILSAENANEGILHVLFYLALFMSTETPAIFGIDNVETALNPLLCRNLIKELAVLARERDKQALITTHNPAILDGLNLHDDDQRLFVVYRDDDGHTRTRRIRLKPDVGEPLRLSELWMRGLLGGLPQGF